MKGFLRRDLCLLRLEARFFLGLIAAIFAAAVFYVRSLTGMIWFVLPLGIGVLERLEFHDDRNGWLAYTVAVPGGRKNVVDARYLIAALMALVLTPVFLLHDLLRGEPQILWTTWFYIGAYLLTASGMLFLGYCWGDTGVKGKLASMISTFVTLGGLLVLYWKVFGVGFSIDLALGQLRQDARGLFNLVALILLLLGLGTLVLSWRLSRRIMEKKEF